MPEQSFDARVERALNKGFTGGLAHARRPRIIVSIIGALAVIAGGFALAAGPTGVGWWVVVVAFLVGVVCLTAARKQVLALTGWAVVLSAIYLVVATAGLLIATRQHLLWESLIALIVSIVTGAVAVLVLIDVARPSAVLARIDKAQIVAVIVAGAAMIVWGMLDGNRLLAFEGFVVGGVGLVGGFSLVRARCQASGGLLLGSVLALGQAVVLLQGTSALNLALALGLVLWVAGIAVFKLALRTSVGEDRVRATAATVASVLSVVAGGVAVYVGSTASSPLAVVGGATLLIVGLSAFGITVIWTELANRIVLGAVVGGAALVLFGFVAMLAALRVPGIALLVAFVLVLTGTFFVMRGEGLVAIMLIALVVLWGMGDRTSPVEADPNPTAASRILAIGDSFISGEGAETYFAGTNQVGSGHNECRRAPTAYPLLVARDQGMGLDFFACSGAKTTDLLSVGQMPDSPSDLPGALPQLGNLDQFSASQIEAIDMVLVSVGGNDVGFSTIVQACLLPRDCNEREAEWLANVDQLGPQLVTTYEAIKERVPNTPILAMPYPEVTGDQACGLGLQDEEHEFVVRFIRRLNGQIRGAAQEAGVNYFEDGVFAFAEHGLCADQPATNHLDLSPPEGHWLQRYSPGKWVHGSMHPNELGHRLTAQALAVDVQRLMGQAAIAEEEARSELVEQLDAGEQVVLPPDAPATLSAEDLVERLTPTDVADAAGVDIDGNPDPVDVPATPPDDDELAEANAAQQALTDNEWISQELFRTVRGLLLPSAALVIGALLATAGLRMLRPKMVPVAPAGGARDERGDGGWGWARDGGT